MQACCDGYCTDLGSDTGSCGTCGKVCNGPDPICVDGQCYPCPVGQTYCAGAGCVDTSTSLQHCGRCSSPCAGTCKGGQCTLAPVRTCEDDGFTSCRNMFGAIFCADTKWDPNFCGGCNSFCGPDQECIDGKCSWL